MIPKRRFYDDDGKWIGGPPSTSSNPCDFIINNPFLKKLHTIVVGTAIVVCILFLFLWIYSITYKIVYNAL